MTKRKHVHKFSVVLREVDSEFASLCVENRCGANLTDIIREALYEYAAILDRARAERIRSRYAKENAVAIFGEPPREPKMPSPFPPSPAKLATCASSKK